MKQNKKILYSVFCDWKTHKLSTYEEPVLVIPNNLDLLKDHLTVTEAKAYSEQHSGYCILETSGKYEIYKESDLIKNLGVNSTISLPLFNIKYFGNKEECNKELSRRNCPDTTIYVYRIVDTGEYKTTKHMPTDVNVAIEYCGSFGNDDIAKKFIDTHMTHWICEDFICTDNLSFDPYHLGPIEDSYSKSCPPIYWGTEDECKEKLKELRSGKPKEPTTSAVQYLDVEGVLRAWLEGKDVEVRLDAGGGTWEDCPKYSKLVPGRVYRIKYIDPIRLKYDEWIKGTDPSNTGMFDAFKAGYSLGIKESI